MRGFSTAGVALRTRSKIVKAKVCEVLGYPVPPSFKKTRPRFFGPVFDTYVQTSDNLQVWNEELSPTRRYVLLRPDAKGNIVRVRVVIGTDLALLDKTGRLTQKYQAQLNPGKALTELISAADTETLQPCLSSARRRKFTSSPIDYPTADCLLSIAAVFDRLKGLVGRSFPDAGIAQERNRGAGLHRLVCKALGYPNYKDDGRFPDVRNQLLEVKLQTSPTIDLGLVTPASEAPLDVPKIGKIQIRHCDVRYALFCGETDGVTVILTRFYLTTGKDFFTRFPPFQGKVLNKKLQIPLPRDFFVVKTESPSH